MASVGIDVLNLVFGNQNFDCSGSEVQATEEFGVGSFDGEIHFARHHDNFRFFLQFADGAVND